MPKTDVRMSAVKTHRKSEEARVAHKSRRNALATTEKKFRAAAAGDDTPKPCGFPFSIPFPPSATRASISWAFRGPFPP